MHNTSSVPVPVLCSGLVTSTPVSRRLVCSTPLPTALSSPVFSSLPSRPQKHRKGGVWKGRKSGGVQERRDPPDSTAILPHSHLSNLQSAPIRGRRRRWAPDLCSRSSRRTSTSSQGQSCLSVSALLSTSLDFFWGSNFRVPSSTPLFVPGTVPAAESDAMYVAA